MPTESSRPVDRAKDHAQRFAMMVASRQSPSIMPPSPPRPVARNGPLTPLINPS